MYPRTIVSFEADFPLINNEDDPPGHELADFVSTQLRLSQIETSGPEDNGWAYYLCATVDGLKVDCTVGAVDDPPVQWQIIGTPQFNLIRWLLRRDTSDNQRHLFSTLDAIIKADFRFRSIRWYYQKDFDRDFGSTYADAP